eukprot:COSAG02_NODE_4016_length_5901_cov_42.404688_5_plen_558_part_00
MSSPFQAPPAGTEVPPSSDTRYFYRRQHFSRNPVTEGNWAGGKTVNITAEASGGHYLVPSECRIVAKILVKSSTGQQLEKSVRFATDPIHSGMFSAGMLSINGTTVESVASNMRDQSIMQLRMDNTTAGADMGGGTAGLLGFSQKMVQSEEHLSPADLAAVKAQNGGNAGGDNANSSAATAGAGGWDGATALQAAVPTDERSDKHELLLNNCSNKRRADGKKFAKNGTAGGNDYAGANAESVGPSPIEISSPMSQGFSFMRQKRAFLPDMQFQWSYTINPDFAQDMFFSEFVPAAVSAVSGANTDNSAAIIPAISAAAGTPTVTVQEIYADLMFAVPRVSIPRGPSMQVPYQAITCYHRQLTANKSFTEVFSGIPASIGMVAVALRDPASSTFVNSELYKLGGDANYGFSRFSLALGALTLPQPAAELDMSEKQVGRAFADWLSLTGGSATNGNGGALANLTGWTSAPILGYRILQDPGAYADTLTLRFDLKTALNGVTAQTAHPTDDELKAGATNRYPYQEMPELVVAVVHQRVFEAFWNDGETFPSRVVVDDVLN